MTALAVNRHLRDYQVLEKFEAGLVLTGQEVKSIKLGRMSLRGSYVVLKGEEVFLIGAVVPPYQPKNAPADYRQDQPRKLLLQKTEIKSLIGQSRQARLTMVPLRVYSKHGKIKLEFGLCRGLKKADKREIIKKRETEREIQRTMKGFRA